MNYLEEMGWRGLIARVSDPKLEQVVHREKITLYSGFDPSAPTLHTGNLMPIMGLRRAQMLGHRPIALVGGATGMIGDPSGKSSERNLLDDETLAANQQGIRGQLERYLDLEHGVLVNNADWFGGMTFVDVLRDVGKHFSVNMMIAKEGVRSRLEDRESGISFTEFSYMIIQAFDFVRLHDEFGCRLQIGGNEQWGNITAGISLARRMRGAEVFGMTLPLLLDSEGKKLGKSEKGAIFLDPNFTSPYEFYQYFIRTADADVGKVLRFLTVLDAATIEGLEEQVAKAPQKREAQRVLAHWLTTFVHGAEEARKAEDAAAALFDANKSGTAIPPEAPHHEIDEAKIGAGYGLVDALAESGLCRSKKAARREIDGGGIYVNGERVQQVEHTLGPTDLQDGRIVLRRGKKTYMVLSVV